jgi:microcystin-dependent protein
MPLTPFDPTQPPDTGFVAAGAASIRNLTQLIINFLSVSFNMTTGQLNPSAIPNGLPTPYGAAGTVLTSTGSATPPSWNVPGTLITGMVVYWPTASAPAGWLNCDGSTPLIATYPALAALLGVTFGGNGTTTFGLPDSRGRVLVGIGTGTASDATAWSVGRTTGTETDTLTINQIPNHSHSYAWAQYSGPHQNGSQPPGVYPVVTGVGSTNSTAVGGNSITPSITDPHNNLQPSIGMNVIIKT